VSKMLPKGWAIAQIIELCSLINGKAFKPSDWSESGLPIIRIQNLNNPNAPFNHFDGILPKKFNVKNGDLLFAWSGTPGTSFGAHIWHGGPALLNQHIFRIVFNENYIDKGFFKYSLNNKLNEFIGNAQGGVGLRHITKTKFEQTSIPFPPLHEQKRIATKLDNLFENVDTCKIHIDKIQKIRNKLIVKFSDYSSNRFESLGKYIEECNDRIGSKWEGRPRIGVSNSKGIIPLRTGKKKTFENNLLKLEIRHPQDF